LIDSTSPAKKIDPLQELSDRIDNIREIEITSRDFVQHRRKQKEVVAVHERDLDVGIACQRIVEVHHRMQPGKTATENQNPSFRLQSHKTFSGNFLLRSND
jgi:hypothetical protein